jgi:hypothetical protein
MPALLTKSRQANISKNNLANSYHTKRQDTTKKKKSFAKQFLAGVIIQIFGKKSSF